MNIKIEDILPANTDCRHYIGEKPCKYKTTCPGCEYYSPMGKRILLIKLGAMGDVLRTTPILRALKHRYPTSYITWVVSESAKPLLEHNELIDRLWITDLKTHLRLSIEKFDIVYNFDKDPIATSLAMLAQTTKRIGFGMDDFGSVISLNQGSDYALALGLSDDLKFKQNMETYQETIFHMAGFEYHDEDYLLQLTEHEWDKSRNLREKYKLDPEDYVIAFNTGAGDVFGTKRLSPAKTAEIGELIAKEKLGKLVLLGGPKEYERNQLIMSLSEFPWIDTGCDNSLREFITIINICDMLICSDTLAMHIALALRKKVIVFFGATCHQEVNLYNRGKKLISQHNCAPCYRRECRHFSFCMEDIPLDEIMSAVKNLISERK